MSVSFREGNASGVSVVFARSTLNAVGKVFFIRLLVLLPSCRLHHVLLQMSAYNLHIRNSTSYSISLSSAPSDDPNRGGHEPKPACESTFSQRYICIIA